FFMFRFFMSGWPVCWAGRFPGSAAARARALAAWQMNWRRVDMLMQAVDRPNRSYLLISNKLRHTRDGNRSYLQLHLPIQRVRHEAFLSIQCLVPRDFLPGVGSHATHDSHERALGHPLAVVDRFAIANAGKQLVVLLLVHIDFRTLIAIAPSLLG